MEIRRFGFINSWTQRPLPKSTVLECVYDLCRIYTVGCDDNPLASVHRWDCLWRESIGAIAPWRAIALGPEPEGRGRGGIRGGDLPVRGRQAGRGIFPDSASYKHRRAGSGGWFTGRLPKAARFGVPAGLRICHCSQAWIGCGYGARCPVGNRVCFREMGPHQMTPNQRANIMSVPTDNET